MKECIVVTCYHSLKDPIIEGLLLRYLIEVNKTQNHYFVLITFEQRRYALNIDESVKTKDHLESLNIHWIPLKYKSGGPFMILKKGLNFLSVFAVVLKFFLVKNIKGFLGFTSISGGIASVLSLVFNKKLIIYCFEPHSTYQLEFGYWTKSSFSYKVLSALERLQVRNASFIVVPTKYSKELVEMMGLKGEVSIMPVSIDENQFSIDMQTRSAVRKELCINENNKVVLYIGKFGGIYYPAEEVVKFYKHLFQNDSSYFFLTITPFDIDLMDNLYLDSKIPENNFRNLNVVPYEMLNKYLNAADVGMLAVPSLPSQRYRTPIKTANYLMSGLPYIVNKGVAEDDLVAEKYKVGSVLDALDPENAKVINSSLQVLFQNEFIREDCRNVGLKLRKLSNTTDLLAKIFNKL